MSRNSLAYYTVSIAFFGTVMWISDYRYDWILLILGSTYGFAAALYMEAFE